VLGEGKSAFVLFYKQQRRFLEHFLNKFLKWIKKSCFLNNRGVFYSHLSEMHSLGSESKNEKCFFCIGRGEEIIMRKMVRGLFVLAAMTAALTMVACSGKKAETTAAAESKMETEAAKESVKADEKDAKETTVAAEEKKDDKKDDKKDAKETTAAAEESESTKESSK